ncbi:MAG: hypothetical protein R3B06_13410 [Kofleriaceae bacterium]
MLTQPAATIQERYAARVKARLERTEITPTDARDGILDCFLATYFQGVTLGLKSLAAIEGTEDDVARVTAAMFRRRLRNHGVTFEAPTLEALAEVKDEVDRELHVIELPAEIRAVHDQVCTLLLAKADGTLPHRGARAVVTAPPPVAAAPTAPVATTAAALPPRPPRPAPAPVPGGAAEELRRTLERHLTRLGADAAAGLSTEQLRRGMVQAEALLAAVDAFSERAAP